MPLQRDGTDGHGTAGGGLEQGPALGQGARLQVAAADRDPVLERGEQLCDSVLKRGEQTYG